jgi:hypothetical protein
MSYFGRDSAQAAIFVPYVRNDDTVRFISAIRETEQTRLVFIGDESIVYRIVISPQYSSDSGNCHADGDAIGISLT